MLQEKLVWKPLSENMLDKLHLLIRKIELSELSPYTTEIHEIKQTFSTKNTKYTGIFSKDTLVAYGLIKYREDENIIYCTGGVDPEWTNKGIGTKLLEYYKKEGENLLKKANSGNKISLLQNRTQKHGHIIVEINDTKKELVHVLEELGFSKENHFHEMRKKLDKPIKNILLPPFKKIQPWNENMEELVRKLNNELSQQLDLPTLDHEQWQEYIKDSNKKWCPILVDKSTDRTKVIGYIIASKYEQDWKILHHKESYIDIITVTQKTEQNILVKALLESHINMCIKDNMDYVAIGIEPDKQPGLYNILETMGFEISYSSTQYISNPIKI